MNQPPSTRKVGRITVAAGLVALGTGLLMDNLLGSSPAYLGLILRFWPVLLIGFGLEYLLMSLIKPEEGNPATRLRFDFLGSLLLFILVGMSAGFHTLSQWISLDPADYVLLGDGVKRTETASLSAEQAKELAVKIGTGRVELYSQRLSEVRVDAEYRLSGLLQRRESAAAMDQYAFNLSGTEKITLENVVPSGLNGTGLSAVYRIYAPEGLKVKVETGAGSVSVIDYRGELNLNAKVGSIYIQVAEGSLEAETGSGTIRVESFTGPVTAKTNVGSILIERVSGDLQLNSGSGTISVMEYSDGKLSAESGAGSIRVKSSYPLNGDLQVKTATGSIHVDLPDELNAKVLAKTRTGSITAPPFMSVNQTGATSRTVEWTSGTGEQQVNLEANVGSIHINMFQPAGQPSALTIPVSPQLSPEPPTQPPQPPTPAS